MTSSQSPTIEDPDNKGPWTEEAKAKFESKSKSLYFDPCQDAAARSIQCLKRNNGDREMCGDYFQMYRDCRQAWMDKRRAERRAAGYLF
ncbi:hypothetical protein ACRALDRAFT_1054585 [Sodiomyces alcalophilus JCM 7366]|uniref:uncharacterized protein n=1 Tax=Sodiomyces alcalophilus JCM 7366 TaxID=591952 RepID=UPI0039B69DF1